VKLWSSGLSATATGHALIFKTLQALICTCSIVLGCLPAWGQIEVIENEEVPAVFGGGARPVSFQIKSGAQDFRAPLQYRIYQAASSILAPVGNVQEWKTIAIPAGARCLESVVVEVPAVRGETLFHLVWLEKERKVGTIRFRAFPQDLLSRALERGESLSLFDPNDHLAAIPAGLSSMSIIRELDALSTITNILVVAPTRELGAARNRELGAALKSRSAAGLASIWIQPDSRMAEKTSTVYAVNQGGGRGNIIVARERVLRDFADSPVSQLNFVWLTELAAGRKTLSIPFAAEP